MPIQRLAVLSRRRALLAASTATLALAVPGTALAGPTVYRTTFSGKTAYASAGSWGPCGESFVSVNANRGRNADTVTGHSAGATASVAIDHFDFCTGEAFFAYGSADLSRRQFTIDPRLARASLEATVPLSDLDGRRLSGVDVDLAWSATSGLSSSNLFERDRSPDGSMLVMRWRGRTREARVSGTVASASVDYTPGTWDPAALASTKSGLLSITKADQPGG
jgi:hypothetical protein